MGFLGELGLGADLLVASADMTPDQIAAIQAANENILDATAGTATYPKNEISLPSWSFPFPLPASNVAQKPNVNLPVIALVAIVTGMFLYFGTGIKR